MVEKDVTEESDIGKEISNDVTRNRKRLMGFGIISIVFGIIGTFMSTQMTIASMLVFGILIIAVGMMFLVEAFSAPDWKEKLMDLLVSLLYIACGIFMVVYPEQSAIGFTFFIAAIFIAIGVIRMVIGFQYKDELKQWGWIVFLGVLDIILGIMIYMQWPESGLWVIGLFLSIALIVQGIAAIIISKNVKKVQNEVKEAVKKAK